MKKLLVTIFLVSVLGYATMPTVNYDEQFDREEIENINKHIINDTLSGLKLETFTFQERIFKTAKGEMVKKNVIVKKVKPGDKVVYINRVINETGKAKRNIVVKNPIPKGTKYLHGSAICDKGCTISYSSNQGATLQSKDDTTQNYNYLEFHFYQILANQEVRMGFRVVIE